MANLPNNFVYLKDIDPTIIQSVRYAGQHNFVGTIIDGYAKDEVILTVQAAEALKQAQKRMKELNYCIVVYDGYRPQRAVNHFIRWAESNDTSQKELYYPTITKAEAFELGYIAKKSSHSRGSTVDLSIIRDGQTIHEIKIKDTTLRDGSSIKSLDDCTVNMGSSFDLMHPASHHDSSLVDKKYLERRNFLRSIMEEHGFKAYHAEWWHYTLNNEIYPDEYFDFPVR